MAGWLVVVTLASTSAPIYNIYTYQVVIKGGDLGHGLSAVDPRLCVHTHAHTESPGDGGGTHTHTITVCLSPGFATVPVASPRLVRTPLFTTACVEWHLCLEQEIKIM